MFILHLTYILISLPQNSLFKIKLNRLFPSFLTEFTFFDPNDAACQEILFNPQTSVSELFAILRQWVPQVQQNIHIIGNEVRILTERS